MNLVTSVKAELIKTKRSASLWLSILGAGFIPLIFLLVYAIKPEKHYTEMHDIPWILHFAHGWQFFASFLLPMFVILICSQIPQIEYKNNAWKQVFTTPQSTGSLFFSKYITILLMILLLFLLYNVFMIAGAIIPNLILPKYTFLSRSIDWSLLLKLNFRFFISLLGIISIQYWLGLRFKNFIVPIGIGLALLVTAMILSSWEHIDKMPYAFPFRTFMETRQPKSGFLSNHEWNSIGYFLLFTGVAFWDLRGNRSR